MKDPGLYVVSLVRDRSEDAESARLAGESQVLHYLYQCYTRVKNLENQVILFPFLYQFKFIKKNDMHCILTNTNELQC